jgi:hypothetical protein
VLALAADLMVQGLDALTGKQLWKQREEIVPAPAEANLFRELLMTDAGLWTWSYDPQQTRARLVGLDVATGAQIAGWVVPPPASKEGLGPRFVAWRPDHLIISLGPDLLYLAIERSK